MDDLTKHEALTLFLEENGGREKDYIILTDDEADDSAKNEIINSLWAFRPEFIASFLNLSPNAVKAIQDSLHEDASEEFKAILEANGNLDDLIDDAIRSEGRGLFLAPYDFEETEFKGFYIYRVN
jgi:hypothetical protein